MTSLLQQYNQQYDKYSAIAEQVKKILSDFLEKEKSYALFGITARAKSPKSLEQKISKNNICTLDSVKDLAGCRVIFYLNEDVQNFEKTNIIRDNFNLLEVKYHNRTRDLVDDANELYTAVHYLIELKESNELSSKYTDGNLRCEIQIQTLLNHAYSETTHNITYKKPDNLIIGKKALEEIDGDFKDLMQKYLLPAGHYLNMIMQKHRKILKANDLAQNIVSDIQNTSCASELIYILDRWKKGVAKYYNEREVKYTIAVQIISSAIKKWESYEQHADAEMLLAKIIEILVYVMPLNVRHFFPIIVKHQGLITPSVLDEINKYLVHITRYYKQHIQMDNYDQQTSVLDLMNEFDDVTLIKMIDFVCLLCKELLQLEIIQEDWVSDINYVEPGKSTSAVNIGFISFPLSDKVKNLRSRTIDFLIKLYSLKAITRQQKEQLILVLSDAAKLPENKNYEIEKAVISNLLVIVKFYTRILPHESFLCKLIYNQVFRFRRFAVQLVQEKWEENSVQELLDLTDIFKNKLTKIKDFEIYNILLSRSVHDYIDDGQWGDPLNYSLEKNAETKTLEYISLINSETEKLWERIIIECVVNKGGYFLREFLYRLGKDQPLFALNLLYKYETTLLDYLINIFNGLLSSEETQQTKNLLETWIIKGKYLELVVKIYRLDNFLVNVIYEKAKNENNFELLKYILKSRYHNEINGQFVLPIIEIFTKAKVALDQDTIINHVINVINDQDLEKILENLIHCKELDQNYLYSIENIASRKAEIVIPFFQKVFDTNFTIHAFNQAWSIGEHLTESLNNLNYYADLSPELFSFLFAIENKKVQDLLYSLINSGDKIKFVIEILEWYGKRGLEANNNIEGILSIMKQLIINSELPDEELTKLEHIITCESRVVIGNYGDSEAYQLRQETMDKWQKCNNTRVKNFAESVNKELNQTVKASRVDEECQAITELVS